MRVIRSEYGANPAGARLPPAAAIMFLLGLFLVILSTACAGSPRVGGSGLSAVVAEAARRAPQEDQPDEGEGEAKKKAKHPEQRRVFHAGREVVETLQVAYLGILRIDRGEKRRCRHDDLVVEEHPSGESPRLLLGLSASRADFEEDTLEESHFYALRVGAVLPETHEQLELDMEIAGADMELGRQIELGMVDALEFSLGGEARYFLAPQRKLSGLHLLAGFRGGVLHWDYATPVLVEDYGRVHEVESDHILTYSPYLGAGMTLVRRGDLRLGTAVLGGYKFFDEHTFEGLYNDLFDPGPFVEVRFALTHVF